MIATAKKNGKEADIDREKLEDLMRSLGFELKHGGSWEDEDDKFSWHELAFDFNDGQFEIVVDEIGEKEQIVVQLGGSCSEEICRYDATHANMLRIAQIWGLI